MSALRPRRLTAVVALAVILGLGGLSWVQPAQAQKPAQTSLLISIQNFAFHPATLTILQGTRVTWMNLDSAPHSATSTDTPVAFDTGILSTGQTGSVTFNQPGTFQYFCKVHPRMRAQIVVQAAGATASTPVPLSARPAPAKQRAHKQKTIATAEVNDKYVFSPVKTTVAVGTKVVWMNKTDAPHTVTSQSAAWKFDRKLGENQRVTWVFHKAGTYQYLCKYHPGMVGTIVVK